MPQHHPKNSRKARTGTRKYLKVVEGKADELPDDVFFYKYFETHSGEAWVQLAQSGVATAVVFKVHPKKSAVGVRAAVEQQPAAADVEHQG